MIWECDARRGRLAHVAPILPPVAVAVKEGVAVGEARGDFAGGEGVEIFLRNQAAVGLAEAEEEDGGDLGDGGRGCRAAM